MLTAVLCYVTINLINDIGGQLKMKNKSRLELAEYLSIESLKLLQFILIIGKLSGFIIASWLIILSPILIVISSGIVTGLFGITYSWIVNIKQKLT